MTRELVKFKDYTREEVQKILDPGSTFKKGTPTWGKFGFIPLPERPGDFVFSSSITYVWEPLHSMRESPPKASCCGNRSGGIR
jgi:hypothetical protein